MGCACTIHKRPRAIEKKDVAGTIFLGWEIQPLKACDQQEESWWINYLTSSHPDVSCQHLPLAKFNWKQGARDCILDAVHRSGPLKTKGINKKMYSKSEGQVENIQNTEIPGNKNLVFGFAFERTEMVSYII